MKLHQFVIAALTLGSAGAMAAANDTSSNLSATSNQSHASSLGDNSQVSQIQQALNDKGYNVGTVDGKMGTKTKSALKQFQQAQGLQASGKADQQTLAALTINGSGASGPSSSENTTSTGTSGNSGFSPQTPPSTSVQSGTNGSMSPSQNNNGSTSSGTNGSTSSGTNSSTGTTPPSKTPS